MAYCITVSHLVSSFAVEKISLSVIAMARPLGESRFKFTTIHFIAVQSPLDYLPLNIISLLLSTKTLFSRRARILICAFYVLVASIAS